MFVVKCNGWFVRGCSSVVQDVNYADHYDSEDEAKRIAKARNGKVIEHTEKKIRIYFGY